MKSNLVIFKNFFQFCKPFTYFLDMMITNEELRQIFAPLEIIEVNYVSGSFFPNVGIKQGAIHYDKEVAFECLLHEIGHLALLPEDVRKKIDGDVDLTAEQQSESGQFYFQGNEDHLIVWQKCVTEQLNLPKYAKYLEESDKDCYKNINKDFVAHLFNKLGMGFDPESKTFTNIVSPL